MSRARRLLPTTTLVVVWVVSALVAHSSPLSRTEGLFSATHPVSIHSFGGAAFSPLLAPVVSPTTKSTSASLSWSRVTASGGSAVSYRVMRTGTSGAIEVCTGVDAPAESNGVMSCVDRSVVADAVYTYTQQPMLVRSGSTTWTRPASTSSAAFVGPRIAFANAGTTVSTTGPAVVVPYPSGTQPGDVLVLVSLSGRQNAPTVPAGWTSLASVGVTGSSAMRLVVAWRLADTATSLAWDPSANASGATVRIMRFVRGNGNSATPVLATAQFASGSRTAVAEFTAAPDIVTTDANAWVAQVVAQRSAGGLTLVTPRGFSVDHSEVDSSGGAPQGLAVGGRQVISAGSVASPSWATPTAGAWAFVTLAFR